MERKTYIVECPHCGANKKVAFFPTPWYRTDDYSFWSDSRIESDKWCEPAYTQQCPTCGKFFTLPPKGTLQQQDQPCDDTGLLPYQTLKIAIEELTGDEHGEPLARLEAWWAFNTLYDDATIAPEKEQAYNRANMEWLAAYYTSRVNRFSHLLFELNRLLGNNDVCQKMIDTLTYEEYLRQREEKNKEKGIVSKLDDQTVREMYDSLIKELKSAMDQPLKIYKKNN